MIQDMTETCRSSTIGRKISREVVEDFFAGDGLNEITASESMIDISDHSGKSDTVKRKRKQKKLSEPEMPRESSMFSYEAEEAEEEKKSGRAGDTGRERNI